MSQHNDVERKFIIMKTPISRIAALVKDDEEAMNVIDILSNPSKDRKKLSKSFEEVLGYDPEKWITKIELNGILDKFIEESGESSLSSTKDDIISETLEIIEERRESFQISCLKEAMIRCSIDNNIISEFAAMYLESDDDVIADEAAWEDHYFTNEIEEDSDTDSESDDDDEDDED